MALVAKLLESLRHWRPPILWPKSLSSEFKHGQRLVLGYQGASDQTSADGHYTHKAYDGKADHGPTTTRCPELPKRELCELWRRGLRRNLTVSVRAKGDLSSPFRRRWPALLMAAANCVRLRIAEWEELALPPQRSASSAAPIKLERTISRFPSIGSHLLFEWSIDN